MSRRRPTAVAALQFLAFGESESFALYELTTPGPALDADVSVAICPSLHPMDAAEILDEIARRLRLREPVTKPPTLRAVRLMLCRIGGAA